MFGEIIGVWVVTALEKYQKVNEIHLVEIGPGKGTMMSDIIRSLHQLGVLTKIHINLVESSAHL